LRKSMTFLAAIGLLLSAGVGFAQPQLSYGGFIAGGGTKIASTNNQAGGYVGGGMITKTSSATHVVQGGLPLDRKSVV